MKSVFVSSTFKDMNFERDILNTRVAPKINYQLSQYNQSMRIVDLRWGVDTTDMTEQEASSRVLSACFNSIEDCKPYMIVLIGDRYGYIPKDYDISVTHMEIIRGVFESADENHVYIYFRDCDYSGVPDDVKDRYIEIEEHAKESLSELKNKLQKMFPNCCRHYKARWSPEQNGLVSDEFESMIISDLENDLVKENEGVCYRSELHKQICENEELLENRVKFAYSNDKKIRAEIAAIEQSEIPYGIIGDGGAGKSVYMSFLCSALREKGNKAHILFCGDNAFSASVRSAAEMVLFILSGELGEDYPYEECAILTYDEIIARIIEKRNSVKGKHYLLLDAVDKCDRGMINYINWCNYFLSGQVRIIFSSRMTEELNEQKSTFELADMINERDDYKEMIRCILNQNTKSISEVHVERLLEKVETPLQLHLLLRRLLNLKSSDFDAIQKLGGGIEAINAYLLQVIDESPADFEELVSEYLKGLLDEYSNPLFAVCLLSFLAYCEHGLQEDDMHELFRMCNVQWISIDYVEFLEQFSFFIRVRDNGRLDISHDVIRQCLCDFFDHNKDTVCSMISLYLLNREKHDVITVRTFFDLVFNGKQLQMFSEFIIKNRKVLESKNVEDSTLSAEIRSGIQRLFLKDDGRFILASVKCCDSVEDVVYFHMVVSSALLGINDFYDEDTVLKIAYAVMFIPMHLELFADDMLFEAELLSCERFLNRHCVSREKIDELKEICQRTAAKYHKKRGDKKQSEERSLESILSDLHKAEAAEKIFIWLKLSKMARSMAENEDTVQNAEALSFELIRVLEEEKFANKSSEEDILYADIYTTLGVVYKTLKEWEKGLYYDGLSLDIYKKLYENTPTDEIYTKYRERVYNIANVAEAWAIEEKNNVQLWSKAKDCYEDCYAMELTAISRGISKRGILQSASSILSLGTALINMGRHEDGMDKYKEGISIIINSAKNNSNPDLYTELSIHMMECVYQLLTCDKKEAAYELASNIREYLTFVINSDLAELKNKITEVCCGFSNEINDIIRRYHDQEDLEGQLLASRILYDMYKVILPVAPYEVRPNIIMTKSNICAILFWNLKDYSRAYDEYMELLNFVTEKDLASPDEHGCHVDQANSRLIDAYSRALMCLERLEREEELERLIGDAPTWARYFADHIDMIKGDSARVLYEIFSTLTRNKSQFGLLLLMMAFDEVADESYDKEAHPETVKMIIEIMSKFSGGNNEEE